MKMLWYTNKLLHPSGLRNKILLLWDFTSACAAAILLKHTIALVKYRTDLTEIIHTLKTKNFVICCRRAFFLFSFAWLHSESCPASLKPSEGCVRAAWHKRESKFESNIHSNVGHMHVFTNPINKFRQFVCRRKKKQNNNAPQPMTKKKKMSKSWHSLHPLSLAWSHVYIQRGFK